MPIEKRLLTAALLFPIFPGLGVFSHSTKDIVYDQANGCCELCGLPVSRHNAEIHHDVPQCRGGSDKPQNGVCLHGERSSTDCHEIVDQRVLKHGICMDGKPISEQPPEKFKSGRVKLTKEDLNFCDQDLTEPSWQTRKIRESKHLKKHNKHKK